MMRGKEEEDGEEEEERQEKNRKLSQPPDWDTGCVSPPLPRPEPFYLGWRGGEEDEEIGEERRMSWVCVAGWFPSYNLLTLNTASVITERLNIDTNITPARRQPDVSLTSAWCYNSDVRLYERRCLGSDHNINVYEIVSISDE
eukprot:9475313-Pyramimonas_sp.AAC.1